MRVSCSRVLEEGVRAGWVLAAGFDGRSWQRRTAPRRSAATPAPTARAPACGWRAYRPRGAWQRRRRTDLVELVPSGSGSRPPTCFHLRELVASRRSRGSGGARTSRSRINFRWAARSAFPGWPPNSCAAIAKSSRDSARRIRSGGRCGGRCWWRWGGVPTAGSLFADTDWLGGVRARARHRHADRRRAGGLRVHHHRHRQRLRAARAVVLGRAQMSPVSGVA